jgi:hypothetical protein
MPRATLMQTEDIGQAPLPEALKNCPFVRMKADPSFQRAGS